MKVAGLEILRCDAGWRNYHFLKLSTDEGIVGWSEFDEGFGSLDAETLDIAVDALECLHGQGRKVGVITHVAAMMERIAVQVRVEKHGSGRSTIAITAPGDA